MAKYNVTTANSTLEFDTQELANPSIKAIDANHFIIFWQNASAAGSTQVVTVNTSTWAVTTANSVLAFSTSATWCSCSKIDDNHFVNFSNSNDGGKAQVCTVSTSTWAVTTSSSVLIYTTQVCYKNSSCKIDATHFINFYSSPHATGNGNVEIFAISTSTWAITTTNTPLVFETQSQNSLGSSYLIDTNHVIFFYSMYDGSFHQKVGVFTVNTTAWAVTTANAPLEFDTGGGQENSCFKIDTNHFINFFCGGASGGELGYVQVFTVNTTTWAVTTAGDSLNYDTALGRTPSCYQIDANHFINFWAGSGLDGYVQVFEVNTSTWAVTTSVARLEFDIVNGYQNSCFIIDSNHFINVWRGADNDGFAQVFTVDAGAVGPANVKTYKGLAAASVKSKKGLVIASIKSVKGVV